MRTAKTLIRLGNELVRCDCVHRSVTLFRDWWNPLPIKQWYIIILYFYIRLVFLFMGNKSKRNDFIILLWQMLNTNRFRNYNFDKLHYWFVSLLESKNIWAPPSEFVSSSIPSLQILTAHAQPFRGARDLAFCLKVPLDSLLVWASSGGSGETARMRRLAWTFAARIGDKYQIRLARPV